MRIAFVTPEYVTEAASFDGGLANYVHRVALSLIQLGHEPVVIVRSDHDEDFVHDGVRVSRVLILDDDWRVKLMQQVRSGKENSATLWQWISFKLNRRLAKLNSEQRFDIVQYSSYLATGLFRINGIPAVTRISSYEPLLQLARGIAEPDHDQLKVRELERKALKKADGVFGPSKLIAKSVEQDIGSHVEIIETPFVLDTKTIDPSIYDSQLAGKQYLLYFGSLNLIKGVDVIGDILHDLFSRHPDKYFVFVGKDTAGMWQQLTDKAGEFKDKILHFDKLQHTQLYPIIQNAELVVLPSRVDNFPNTCLEAMAFKRVVVGTRGTSFEQLIDDGSSGLLCNREDAPDLLKVIDKALSLSPEVKKSIGEKAAARIAQLSPEKVVAQLVQYYSDIITAKTH